MEEKEKSLEAEIEFEEKNKTLENDVSEDGTQKKINEDKKNENDKNDKENSEVLEKNEEFYEEKIEEINNRLLRLQADFLNYKARIEKEKTKYYNDALEDLVCSMLPIIDNFERALEDQDPDESFTQGIKMILNQILNMLNKYGVEAIDALGKKFDPNLHHGVMTEESEQKEGTVIEVFQKGYKLKNKVIRPSMVKISK